MQQSGLTPLEAAVTTALSQDPAVPRDAKDQAHAFCDAFQKSDGAWLHCCEQFLARSSDANEAVAATDQTKDTNVNDYLVEVRFWYVRVIVDSLGGRTPAERADIRRFLLAYVLQTLPSRAQLVAKLKREGGGPTAAENPAVLSKLALLYVRCLVVDYPTTWPEGVSALLAAWEDARRKAKAAPSLDASLSLDGSRDMAAAIREGFIAVTHFLLAVMETFDDEVVAESIARKQDERNRNALVKDAMREGDIILLAGVWEAVLGEFTTPPWGFVQEEVRAVELAICARMLRVLAKFVAWVDIQVIANKSFLSAAFKLMDTASKECGPAAMDLIGAIYHKRMDAAQRIFMTHSLQLLPEVLHRVSPSTFSSSESNGADTYMTNPACTDPSFFQLRLGELLCLIGSQLLNSFVELRRGFVPVSQLEAEADLRRLGGVQAAGPNPYFVTIPDADSWMQIQQEGWTMIEQILMKACLLYSHPHPALAETVEPFVSEVMRSLKGIVIGENGQLIHSGLLSSSSSSGVPGDTSTGLLWIPIDSIRPILTSLLRITLSHVQFPFWFNFESDDEAHETFRVFRKDISQLFKRLYALDEPGSGAPFLLECEQRLHAAMRCNASSEQGVLHPNQVEAVLYLILVAGEHYRDVIKELLLRNKQPSGHPLTSCLRSVLTSAELMTLPYPHVRVIMCDLICRYYSVLLQSSRQTTTFDLLPGLPTDLPQKVLGYLLSNWDSSPAQAVAEHATVALLRIVKSNLPQMVQFTDFILSELARAQLLEVVYWDSRHWPMSQQRGSSEGARPPAAAAPPAGDPSKPWTLDDQNRCFEVVGLLLGAQLQSHPERVRSTLQSLVERWLQPLEELAANQKQARLQLLWETDPRGAVDFVNRLLYAVANLSKGISPIPLLEDHWKRVLPALLVALQEFGADSRIRGACIVLLRRLVVLLQSQQSAKALIELLPLLFNMTFVAAVFASSFPLDKQQVLSSFREDADVAVAFKTSVEPALWRMHCLVSSPNTTRLLLATHPPSSSFDGHQEVSQLCSLVSFVAVTLRNEAAGAVFLASVAGWPVYYSGQGRPPPQQQNVSSAGCLQQAQTTILPLFLRFFNQCVDYWLVMPSESQEMRREKSDLRRDIYSLINSLATHTPAALLKLFEAEEEQAARQSATSQPLTPLLDWMANGAHPLSLHSIAGTAICLQAWTTLLAYIRRFVAAAEERADAADPEVLLEALIFDKLRMAHLLLSATQLGFNLDMENPQHTKTLQEICGLIRVLVVAPAEAKASRRRLATKVHQLFLAGIPTSICSPQEATLVLEAVAESATPRDAMGVLRKWIMTQQISAAAAAVHLVTTSNGTVS